MTSQRSTEDAMPDSWNPETYRIRAEEWRERAKALPPGKERDAYLALTEGYAHLAKLVEEESSR